MTGGMWRRYLRFWGPSVNADVDDELRTHLELRVEDNLARGLSPDEARREAEQRFGDVERVRAECRTIGHQQERAMRRAATAEALVQDLRYAARTLRRAPTFTLVAVLSLALGIGANVAIFRLIDAVVLRPLPGIVRPETLVELTGRSLSYPAVRAMQESGIFAGLAGYRSRTMSLGTGDGTAVIDGGIVSGDYFRLLGARPALGRTFAADEDRPGVRTPVVVLSHAFWQRQFGGDPRVVGRMVRINGAPFTVIGVGPRGFRGTRVALSPDLWMPINAWPLTAVGSYAALDIDDAGWGWMSAVARLRPGDTPAQAQERLRAVMLDHDGRLDDGPGGPPIPRLRPALASAAALGDSGPGADRFVLVLAAVVGLTLLIACANLAGLMLARAARRQRELGVRLALGAGRGRLVRQLLTESLALAALGGLAGLAVGVLGGRLLTSFALPGGIELASLGSDLSGRMVLAAVALTLCSAALFGLLPALQASRPDLVHALRTGGQPPARTRLRSALVVAQLALCLVLLAGAGLFVRSLRAALGADTGYETRRVAVALVNTGLQRYDNVRSTTFYAALRERLAARPGVDAVALAAWLPLTGDENVFSFRVPPTGGDTTTHRTLRVNLVSPDYFRVVGVPLRAGRDFTERDVASAPTVAVVNETMARRYWPGGRAVGGRLQLGQVDVTVVGVVRDAGYVELGEAPGPFVYLPIAQSPEDVLSNQVAVVARTDGRPADLVPALREAARALDRDVPVLEATTFDALLAQLLLPQRLAATLLGLFGALTLLLAAIGVYGVIAYAVGQRTREIGIRIALGAPRRRVLGDVLGQGARLVGAGVAIGLALALAAGRVVAAFLYGIGADDPWAFAASALVLGLVALLATYLPARRASRVDPSAALRME